MKSTFSMIVISCATVAALALLLARRAEQPDTYPEFSTYRTLPEGTSVLYEALRRAPGMSAGRNVHPLGAASFNNAAVMLLGMLSIAVDVDEVEGLARRGNRVIIGLLPHRNRFIQPRPSRPDEFQPFEPLKRWDVRLDFFRKFDFRDEKEQPLTRGWPMYFAEAKGWDTLRKEKDKPVVIQRPMGKGSIVLMANSYLLSNSALVDDRQITFLSDVIGPVHQTIFDETHFGIQETGSIAALARRYHLEGLALGLALVAALFIWKSAAGFPPAWDRLQSVQAVAGEDSNASFLNLLRRNIKRDDILAACVEEWRKMNQRKAGNRLPAAVDLAESGRKTPAQTYVQIQRILGAKQNLS